MNADLPKLLAALRRTLHDAVAPELATAQARTQLAAVEDILGKLEAMVVWSPAAEREQQAALEAGCAAFHACAVEAGMTPPVAEGPPAARLAALTDWLFDAPPGLADATGAALHAILRQALRQQLLVERKLIPLTDFGAMTAASKP